MIVLIKPTNLWRSSQHGWIDYTIGRAAAEEWIHAIHLGIIDDVTFEEDEDRNFTGSWSTLAEDNLEAMLEEDMGVTLDLSAMDGLPDTSNCMLLTQDDATNYSFGTVLGRGRESTEDQQDRAPPPADKGAAPGDTSSCPVAA